MGTNGFEKRPQDINRDGNKVASGLRAQKAVWSVFEQMGGVQGMLDWGKTNPDEFYKIFGKLIPKPVELSGADGGDIIVKILDGAESV